MYQLPIRRHGDSFQRIWFLCVVIWDGQLVYLIFHLVIIFCGVVLRVKCSSTDQLPLRNWKPPVVKEQIEFQDKWLRGRWKTVEYVHGKKANFRNHKWFYFQLFFVQSFISYMTRRPATFNICRSRQNRTWIPLGPRHQRLTHEFFGPTNVQE